MTDAFEANYFFYGEGFDNLQQDDYVLQPLEIDPVAQYGQQPDYYWPDHPLLELPNIPQYDGGYEEHQQQLMAQKPQEFDYELNYGYQREHLDQDIVQAAREADSLVPQEPSSPFRDTYKPIRSSARKYNKKKKPETPLLFGTKKKKQMRNAGNCIQVSLMSGLAFYNSGRDRCSLKELYAFVCENFENFDITQEDWKKSIRHSLCTHSDMYAKDAGEGNWMFRSRERWLERFNEWCCKHPDLTKYGLKDINQWSLISSGTKGLPRIDLGRNLYQKRKATVSPDGASRVKRLSIRQEETSGEETSRESVDMKDLWERYYALNGEQYAQFCRNYGYYPQQAMQFNQQQAAAFAPFYAANNNVAAAPDEFDGEPEAGILL